MAGVDAAAGDADEIQQPIFRQAPGDFRRVFRLDAGPGRVFVADQAQADDGIAPQLVAHALDNLAGEAQPVVQRTAVLVAALVGQRRQKLADQAVLTGVEFDPIQTAVNRVTRREPEAFDDRRDVVGVHRLRQFAAIHFRHWRRRPQRQLRIMAATLHPAVGQMRQRQSPMAMHRVRYHAIAVHHGGIIAEHRVFVGPIRGMHRTAFQHDQPGSARRAGFVVGGVALGETVVGGEVGLMSGEHEPIRRGLAAQR